MTTPPLLANPPPLYQGILPLLGATAALDISIKSFLLEIRPHTPDSHIHDGAGSSSFD